jgi:hypothetical protein
MLNHKFLWIFTCTFTAILISRIKKQQHLNWSIYTHTRTYIGKHTNGIVEHTVHTIVIQIKIKISSSNMYILLKGLWHILDRYKYIFTIGSQNHTAVLAGMVLACLRKPITFLVLWYHKIGWRLGGGRRVDDNNPTNGTIWTLPKPYCSLHKLERLDAGKLPHTVHVSVLFSQFTNIINWQLLTRSQS